MATRGRSADRAATRRRRVLSLGLLLVVSGTAVASAHGLPTAPTRATAPADGSALTRTVASAATILLPEASAVSFSRWATALTAGHQPAVGRPFRATPPIPTALPPAAHVAYQRAAAVLAGEAPGCALDWSLLAAIGHVESDHGRRGASTLGADGVSRPGVVGPAIDVPGLRGPLPDTDGGDLDGTGTEDRAVGALQLLPSAWSAAAVDGDADGLRNPQDVDDAALAAGVLLCASSPGLGSEAGQRLALRHYNPARGYVDTVQRLAKAYALTEVVTTVVAAVVDVVPGPPQLPGTTGAETHPTAATATPTPLVTPSARERVPTPARTPSASSLPSPELPAPGSTVPSPIAAAAATEGVSSPGNASASTPTPSGTSGPEPATASEPGPEPEPRPEPEQTREPGPGPSPDPTNEPAPEPPASSEPTPAPTPEQEAGDAAAPTTSSAPDLQTVRGVWSLDGASTFLLDRTTVVDVDALGDLTAAAPADLDGDGAAESVHEELTELAGSTVEVVGTTSPDRVTIRSLDDLRVAP